MHWFEGALSLWPTEIAVCTHLEGIGLGSGRRLNGRVESLLLGVVGHLVHGVEEVEVRLLDLGQVRREARQRLLGLGLGVAGGASRDGDVVEGGVGEDGALANGAGGGDGGQDGSDDGEGLHFEMRVLKVWLVVLKDWLDGTVNGRLWKISQLSWKRMG